MRKQNFNRISNKGITIAQKSSLCAVRHAAAFVRGNDVIHKLFTELAYQYK
ncbi:hypothetical protein LguiA_003318 [Lonicera macranthoides]